MKSDARLLLNKRKWKNASSNQKTESWNRRGGTVDARKILNLKRSQMKSKAPVIGSFMRTKTATSFIASQIKKEISGAQVPDKRVKLSEDGNLIITSKSNSISRNLREFPRIPPEPRIAKNFQYYYNQRLMEERFCPRLALYQGQYIPPPRAAQQEWRPKPPYSGIMVNLKKAVVMHRSHDRLQRAEVTRRICQMSSGSALGPRPFPPRSRIIGNSMDIEPSTSEMDDLEQTGIEDLLDIDALPSTFVSSNTVQSANLSRNSFVGNILNNRHTMVADQLSHSPGIVSAKVYVSNLHPTVSKQDVMELFGDIGLIKNAEMLRPGTAVIDFYSSDDAEKACEIYHNRLLDGLPMKCHMQENDRPQRAAISHRLGRFVSPKSPIIHEPVSSVISTNPRSRYNPRNVQFTVKLT